MEGLRLSHARGAFPTSRAIPPRREMPGAYEHHHIGGWPRGEADGLYRCSEHENCAVWSFLIDAPIIRQVIVEKSEPPWIGRG